MSCKPPSSVTLGRLSVKLLASNWKITGNKSDCNDLLLQKISYARDINFNKSKQYLLSVFFYSSSFSKLRQA